MYEKRNVPAPVAAGNEDLRPQSLKDQPRRRVYHQRRYIDADGTRVMWCGRRHRGPVPGSSSTERVDCPLCGLAVQIAHESLAA